MVALPMSKVNGSYRQAAKLGTFDLMLAVRKDLGYKNNKLNRGDLLRIFINDLEQHRKALNLPKH
jgi:hypothetical protein